VRSLGRSWIWRALAWAVECWRLGDVAPMMVAFSDSTKVPAPIDRVWDIVSDVDNEPRYYPGLETIRNIRRTGNLIEREVTVSFRDSKGRQTVVLHPKE